MAKLNDYLKLQGAHTLYEESESQALTYCFKDKSIYFWGLKVSSRVMDEMSDQLNLQVGQQSFIYGKPIHKFSVINRLPDIDQVFFLIRNPKEKVYSGLLESSNYKRYVVIRESNLQPSFVQGFTPDQYKKKLINYLKLSYTRVLKNSVLDGHHSRYFKSLYNTSKFLKGTNLFLIDIDTPDFNFNYNILAAQEYSIDHPLRPELHTNKSGYIIVEETLNENKHEPWAAYWIKLAKEEEAFYKLLTSRFKSISRATYEELIADKFV